MGENAAKSGAGRIQGQTAPESPVTPPPQSNSLSIFSRCVSFERSNEANIEETGSRANSEGRTVRVM